MDKENQLIEQLGNSMSWICMGVLEGKTEAFDQNYRKLLNLFNFVQEEKKKYKLDEKTTDQIVLEAKGKRSHVYEACKEIPFSQLLRIAEINKKTAVKNPDLKKYLQCGYCIIGVWLDTVLQEHYRMNKAQRKEIFLTMNDWIDSYQKGYLSNEGIREMFIEDIGYDLLEGKFVGGEDEKE